jgi:hypothetical protein
MSDKKVYELTIMDITERMLQFHAREDIAEAVGFSDYNKGTCDALTQMREDMRELTESEFIAKYDEISLEKGDELFELDEDDDRAQYLQGYCSIIEDVLSFINPGYTYDQMTMLEEGIDFDEEFEAAFYGSSEYHRHDADDDDEDGCDCGCGHHHHH